MYVRCLSWIGLYGWKGCGRIGRIGWQRFWLAESSCLFLRSVTGGCVDTYCGAVSMAILSSLMFADDIPKGASRGAATPIGALLRKDMASVCVAEVVL
jgi:hypothetical protein